MWLHLPPTLASSLASPDSTSPSDASFDALAASCTWRTKSRQPRDWRRVWKTEASIRRLFGATWGRSQRDCSEAVSTWLSGAFPVRTCPSPARGPASTALDPDSSSRSFVPFATWDAATSSWRTCQRSLLDESLMPFSGRWPKSGSLRNGAVYEQRTLVRLMAGIAGGAWRGIANRWPTPRVSAERSSRASMTRDGHWAAPSLEQVAELSMGILPREFDSPEELKGRSKAMWPTPAADRVSQRTDTQLSGDGRETPNKLGWAVAKWATPSASPWRSGDASDETFEKNSRPLNEQATRFWSTPLGSEPRQGYKGGSQYQQSLSTEAVDFLTGLPDQTTETPGQPSSNAGPTSRPQLSALFEEWLMAFPLGWTCVCAPEATGSEDSATPSCPSRPKQPCASSGSAPSESGRD